MLYYVMFVMLCYVMKPPDSRNSNVRIIVSGNVSGSTTARLRKPARDSKRVGLHLWQDISDHYLQLNNSGTQGAVHIVRHARERVGGVREGVTVCDRGRVQ